MTREELLLKLRDIEAPPEPPWWLLAPAWFWLGGALLAILGVAWWWRNHRRHERLARIARAELQAIHSGFRHDGDTRLLAYRVSRWLKQVALLAYPGQPIQRISGEAWLGILDRHLDDQPFSRGCGRIFGHQLYQRNLEIDTEQVITLCERWLRSIQPSLQARSSNR